MKRLSLLDVATLIATSTRSACIVIEAPIGTDMSGLGDIVQPDVLQATSEAGWAVMRSDSFVEGALAYSDIERRMSLVPGGTVTLVQDDGTIRSRSEPGGIVLTVDFSQQVQHLDAAA